MVFQVKRKKLILSVAVFSLAALTVAVIKFMPEKSAPAEKAQPLKQEAGASARKKTAKTARAAPARPKNDDTIAPDEIRDKETGSEPRYREEEEEEAEAARNDTPQKAEMRASLEQDIRVLSEQKEKETKELNTLIKSFDDALSNSQLPPEELAAKKLEIEIVKQTLMSTYNEKLSSIDASLKEKTSKYREVTQKKKN